MAYTRDPTPSIILSPSGDFKGTVWASGLFRGFMRFQDDNQIDVIINCLMEGRGELLALEREDGRMERTQRALQMCARCLWVGGRVLVHCKHGIHRTGSFITLLLAMLLMMSTRSMPSSSTSQRPSWSETFELAWQFWAAQRGLEGRVNNRHDFYQESWEAFYEYYGSAPTDVIQGMYTATAEAVIQECADFRAVRRVLQSIRRVIIPVELTPAPVSQRKPKPSRSPPDVSGVGDVGDGEGRARSRSPLARAKPVSKRQPKPPRPPPDVKDVGDVGDGEGRARSRSPPAVSKRQPKPSAKLTPAPPPEPPAPPPAPPPDTKVHWRAESVVEGEESQMPWRPFLKGDWRCSRCGNHNMHWRGYCFGQHGQCRNPRDANFRPGDWYCQCGNYNLYWRTHCNRGKCGRSRAGGGEQQPLGL